jgi:precorrin-6B methylase 2
VLLLFLALQGEEEVGGREIRLGLELIENGEESRLDADLKDLVERGLVAQRNAGSRPLFAATDLGIERGLALVDDASAACPETVQVLYEMKRDGLQAVATARANESKHRSQLRGLRRRARGLAGTLLHERRLDTARTAVEASHFHPERVRYAPSKWRVTQRVLKDLAVGEEDVFVDFGSGKGRVVYHAARYPFKRVIGVEISPQLNRIAELNIERRRAKLNCRQIELITADMTEFNVPDTMTVAYMYIPVTGGLFRRVIENIVASLDRRPRSLRLIYVYPRNHPLGLDGEEAVSATCRFHLTPESLRGAYDDDGQRIAIFESHPQPIDAETGPPPSG